jgi:hypothetical protein
MEDVHDDIQIVLVYNGSAAGKTGLGNSFSLFIPQGHQLQLLRRLTYSGCKPIGEREYRKLMLEAHQRVFPYDYPDT